MTDRKVQLGVGSLETMDGARVAYLTEYLVGQGWLREQAAVACADWVAGRRDKLAETSLPVLEGWVLYSTAVALTVVGAVIDAIGS